MLSAFKSRQRRHPYHYSNQTSQHIDLSYPPYEPNCPQIAEFHQRTEKIRAVFGGNRSGKTYSTTFEVLNHLRQIPNGIGWAATVTYDGVGQYLWPTYKRHLAPDEILEISWLRYSQRIPAVVRLRGFTLYFRSYEQGREKFQGSNVDIIHLDEEPPKDVYHECLARTVDRKGKIVFSMTPLKGKTWIHKDIFEKADESPHIWKTTVSLFDNRFIDEEEKQVMLDTYGQDEAIRRIEGLFMTLEGAVFKEFDASVSVVPRFPIPTDWRIVRAIDFGFTNPFCCLWGALNDDHELIIFQEHYQAQTLLQEHADIIQAQDTDRSLYADTGTVSVEATTADHARQERAELEQYGIFTEPAEKDVKLSIAILNRLMKPKANGRPSVYIMDDLTNLINEVEGYRYKPVRDGHEDKEEPLKIDDHSVDALRYLATYFFAAGFRADNEPYAISAATSELDF